MYLIKNKGSWRDVKLKREEDKQPFMQRDNIQEDPNGLCNENQTCRHHHHHHHHRQLFYGCAVHSFSLFIGTAIERKEEIKICHISRHALDPLHYKTPNLRRQQKGKIKEHWALTTLKDLAHDSNSQQFILWKQQQQEPFISKQDFNGQLTYKTRHAFPKK